MDISLSTISGQEVIRMTEVNQGSAQIDISSLPMGVYWVNIIMNEQCFVQKLIKG